MKVTMIAGRWLESKSDYQMVPPYPTHLLLQKHSTQSISLRLV